MRAPRALSFDCYGTLIDWDGGLRAAVAATTSLAGCDVERLLGARERIEAEIEAGPFLLYGEVLRRSLAAAAAEQGRQPSEGELHAFAASMVRWPPFADSAAALARLATRFRLAILSNVESAVLRASVALLGARFEALVTAEELRSYKPARAHFDAALARLALPREEVLHVAGSLHHDIEPALALGWRCAWIDRRGEGSSGSLRPALVCRSLAELADLLLALSPP